MIRIDRLVARAAALALALFVAAPASHAQGGGGGAAQDSQRRARLEQQVRERLAGVVQERLRLTDAQMTRLKQTNARFEPQRRQLFQQERQVRLALRQEAARDSLANQQHVSTLITQAIAIQRQRLDLVDAEQKELAQFLTPLQRARYLDLQEKLRQRVEQLRHGQGGGGGAAWRNGPAGVGPTVVLDSHDCAPWLAG